MKKKISKSEMLNQTLENKIPKTKQFLDMLIEAGDVGISTQKFSALDHRFSSLKHNLMRKGYLIERTDYREGKLVFSIYKYLGKDENFVYKTAKERMYEDWEKNNYYFFSPQTFEKFLNEHNATIKGK
jgi:hypothetical protein